MTHERHRRGVMFGVDPELAEGCRGQRATAASMLRPVRYTVAPAWRLAAGAARRLRKGQQVTRGVAGRSSARWRAAA